MHIHNSITTYHYIHTCRAETPVYFFITDPACLQKNESSKRGGKPARTSIKIHRHTMALAHTILETDTCTQSYKYIRTCTNTQDNDVRISYTIIPNFKITTSSALDVHVWVNKINKYYIRSMILSLRAVFSCFGFASLESLVSENNSWASPYI